MWCKIKTFNLRHLKTIDEKIGMTKKIKWSSIYCTILYLEAVRVNHFFNCLIKSKSFAFQLLTVFHYDNFKIKQSER